MGRNSVISNVTGAVTDVAIFSTLFLMFATVQMETPMQPSVPYWVLTAVLLTAVNHLFLRKERALPSVVMLNIIGFAITIAVLLIMLDSSAGFGAVFFTVSFSIVTVGLITYRALNPPTPKKMVLKLDAFLLCAAFYALTSARGGLSAEYPQFLLGVLILNMAVLAYLCAQSGEGGVRCASSLAGFMVFAGYYSVVGAFLFLVVRLFPSGARDAAEQLSALLASSFLALLRFILRVMESVFSLINLADHSLPGDQGISGGINEEPLIIEVIEFDPDSQTVVAIIAVSLIFLALMYLLFRFRRKRFGTAGQKREGSPVRSYKVRGAFMRRLSAMFAVIMLRLKAFYFRNTPPGVLMYAERCGRRRGIMRESSETQRAYLSRLAHEAEGTGSDLPPLLTRLAGVLDERYYSATPPQQKIASRELRQIRRSLRALGKK